MSELVDIPLATGLGEDESSYVSDLELTNLMLKPNPPGSRKPFHISSVPTLSSSGMSTPTTGAIRGMCRDQDTGNLWVVQGTSVYVGGPGSWIFADVFAGTDACRMIYTGTHIVIVDGTNAACFNTATAASDGISIAGWIDATYQDGYTVYADALSQSFYVSSLDDPTMISALDFTTADALPGNIVGIASVNREVSAFKTGSIEHYFNAGGSGFPFSRTSPGVIERGCWPPRTNSLSLLLQGVNTIQEYGGRVYWLGDDGRVYRKQGYQAEAISTPWVDRYLKDNISGVVLFGSVYTLDGSAHYAISGFTEGGIEMSLVCSLETGLWHKRYSSISSVLRITHMVDWPAGGADKQVIVAAKNTGTGNSTLYYLDPAGTNDSGASSQVNRVMTLPQLAYGDKRVGMYEIILDMQKPSTTGTITLSWSDNGGTSYTSGVTNTGGNARTRWQRLGSFYQRILRVTFSIASKISIMGVRARIEVGE